MFSVALMRYRHLQCAWWILIELIKQTVLVRITYVDRLQERLALGITNLKQTIKKANGMSNASNIASYIRLPHIAFIHSFKIV